MLYPRANLPAGFRRVVITGAGVVTALGAGWKANAEGFRVGRRMFRPITLFDVSRQRVQSAAQAKLPLALPRTHLSPRQSARLDRATQMLLMAACEGWNQAGWARDGELPMVLGTTAGGMALGEAYFRQALLEPQRLRRQPTRAVYYQSQMQARLMADALGIAGPTLIVSNACASGANAIGQAWEWVRGGRADRALAGGYDALTQLVFSGFDSLQALSPTACRPFDAGRDGLSLGEGAAVVVLETLDSARKRGADILGELIGYGTTIDAHHLTQPQPEGDAALKSMAAACDAARVTPAQIDYVNAHGTGTPLNDSAEALAIGRWAASHAATLPVSSTKASIGHLLGAAGAVEAVVCLMCLREQWLPPEIAFERPDPACVFPVVSRPTEARVELAMSNSFGFGGVNATLVFRRWP